MYLDQVIEMLDVKITRTPTVTGAWGEYDHTHRVIRLDPRLSGVPYTSTLAHELGHAAHGHTQSTVVTEREADQYAQWLLIPFCRYLEAARAYDTVEAVAHEIGVLPGDIIRYAERLHHRGHACVS